MQRSVLFVAGLMLAAALAQTVSAQSVAETNQAIDNILGDHAPYEAAIKALQMDLAASDLQAVADLVSYPITVTIGGKRHKVASATDFLRNYKAIFTPAITKAVLEQHYETLFVNDQGVMFGKGEVWLNGICKDTACTTFDVKIVTIQATDN
ncbi:MAG TPA: hypothetical protein VGM83_20985 [Devosiaceae bacterium]|jgi:hypothetical protein